MQLQKIQTKIHEIRGHKVMPAPIAIGVDLAELYEVETRVLNQAVKRNIKRFPSDFMFQLTKPEWDVLMSQFVISKTMSSQIVMTKVETRGGIRKLPFAFTEQGLAMLSGILNSDKAINVNIGIMRAFVVLRQFALTNDSLTQKLKEIETKYDRQFKDVYEAINFLLNKEKQQILQQKRKRIGFNK